MVLISVEFVAFPADEYMNLNVTNSFMDLLKVTKAKWTEDYFNANK